MKNKNKPFKYQIIRIKDTYSAQDRSTSQLILQVWEKLIIHKIFKNYRRELGLVPIFSSPRIRL